MTAWSKDELTSIGEADQLEIAPRREDGTLRNPTTIWVVRDGDAPYIRSSREHEGGWFRAAQASHQGHVTAGDVETDVQLVDAEESTNPGVDTAYRSKYGRYGGRYVEQMTSPEARATTLKLIPGATS